MMSVVRVTFLFGVNLYDVALNNKMKGCIILVTFCFKPLGMFHLTKSFEFRLQSACNFLPYTLKGLSNSKTLMSLTNPRNDILHLN